MACEKCMQCLWARHHIALRINGEIGFDWL